MPMMLTSASPSFCEYVSVINLDEVAKRSFLLESLQHNFNNEQNVCPKNHPVLLTKLGSLYSNYVIVQCLDYVLNTSRSCLLE